MSVGPRIFIHASGGIGPNADLNLDYFGHAALPLHNDAAPVSLRALTKPWALPNLRVASRFSELAVIGAVRCMQHDASLPSLSAAARVYLGTGLGEIVRTDALYAQVMPPSAEMASPLQFVSSGNNMAAFFVAQCAGLQSRNFTVSQGDLSFEAALSLAVGDLRAGACAEAIVGGVDECTTPRPMYWQRLALDPSQPIGEGSGWLRLATTRENAIGELLDVHTVAEDALAEVAQTYRADLLLRGGRVNSRLATHLAAQCGATEHCEYTSFTGPYPTAGALGVAGLFTHRHARALTALHANLDGDGRAGLIALRVFV